MGDIPSKSNMISAIITNPQTGGNIAANTDFDITVQMQNLVAGSFTDAQETYYSAPQQLQGGKIVGHTHVTVQDMNGNMNPTQPLNPETFVFFKGINDAGNGNGLLSATVTGGLPEGTYRVCTITSASNHQPAVMPVAQRGAQEDCSKFTVGGNGGNNNK
jgi:transcription initiation factor TFIID subunit 15